MSDATDAEGMCLGLVADSTLERSTLLREARRQIRSEEEEEEEKEEEEGEKGEEGEGYLH